MCLEVLEEEMEEDRYILGSLSSFSFTLPTFFPREIKDGKMWKKCEKEGRESQVPVFISTFRARALRTLEQRVFWEPEFDVVTSCL